MGFLSQVILRRTNCYGMFCSCSQVDYWYLFRALKESAASFPDGFAANRVLPPLISALEFGGASAATVLPLVLQLGKSLPNDKYDTRVLEPIVKLFASPDRGTRMALLESLPEFGERFDSKTVVDKIWPNLVRWHDAPKLTAINLLPANRIYRYGTSDKRGNCQSYEYTIP